MMKRLVYICFVIIVSFAGCSKEDEVNSFSSSQLEALKYLPSRSQFVLYMNLEDLRKTDYWEEYILSSLLKRDEAEIIRSLERQLGIGFNKGISDLYFSTGEKNQKYILLNTGENEIKLDNNNLFNSENYNGKNYFVSKSKQGLFFYKTGSLVLISDDENYICSVIEEKANPINKDKSYLEVLNLIPDKKSYWICTNKSEYAARVIERVVKDARPFKKVLRTIDNITVCADFADNVLLQSVVGCKDAGSSGLLVTGIKSALIMGLFDKNEQIGEILDKLDVSRSGKNIYFDLELNKQDLKNIKIIADKKNIEEKL